MRCWGRDAGDEFRIDGIKKVKSIFQAVKDGNFGKFVAEFERLDNVEETNLKGQTLLHLASETGQTSIVDLLIRNDANVNAKDHKGRSALILACARPNNFDVVRLLLTHGANVNQTDYKGRNCLYIASKIGNKRVVQAIRAQGGKLPDNPPDDGGLSISNSNVSAGLENDNEVLVEHNLVKARKEAEFTNIVKRHLPVWFTSKNGNEIEFHQTNDVGCIYRVNGEDRIKNCQLKIDYLKGTIDVCGVSCGEWENVRTTLVPVEQRKYVFQKLKTHINSIIESKRPAGDPTKPDSGASVGSTASGNVSGSRSRSHQRPVQTDILAISKLTDKIESLMHENNVLKLNNERLQIEKQTVVEERDNFKQKYEELKTDYDLLRLSKEDELQEAHSKIQDLQEKQMKITKESQLEDENSIIDRVRETVRAEMEAMKKQLRHEEKEKSIKKSKMSKNDPSHPTNGSSLNSPNKKTDQIFKSRMEEDGKTT